MNKYIYAKEGFKFSPSEKGKKEGKVFAKYRDEYAHRGQYEKQVPESWIKNEYVEEVPI